MRQSRIVSSRINFNTMKTISVASIVCLLFVLFTSSCTIEKRVHLKGYHIEWNGHNKSSAAPTMVKKEKIKDDYQVAEISDSLGTLIKAAIADKNAVNQDSILEVIGELMLSSSKKNTLQANVTSEKTSKNSSPKSFSSILSRQFELMQISTAFENSSQAIDSTEKTPDYVEPEKENTNYYSVISKGERLGNWSLILFLVGLLLYIPLLVAPFVAIAGLVQSNKEIKATGTDQQTEMIRHKARKGKVRSIVVLGIYGFFLVLGAAILAYSTHPNTI